MVIYFGADHRGFALKGHLLELVRNMGYEVADCGNTALEPGDSYVIFASEVAKRVAADPAGSRGVVVCGAGAGVDMVANKFDGVRSVLGINPDQVHAARHDDDANVLSLAADMTEREDAEKMIKIFLATPFGNEPRRSERLAEIKEIEKNN